MAEATEILRRSHTFMWIAMLAVIAVVVTAYALGVRPALLLLSGSLLAFAIVRAVSPSPGPYGISCRSRAFDMSLLAAGALFIAAVTFSLPATTLG